MAKRKRQRIQAIKQFENVTETPHELKEHWFSRVFKNENPIMMELGCGRGDFILEWAKKHPEFNCIGVDLKGPRIWAGATRAQQDNVQNLYFIRSNILDLADAFEPHTVAKVWITFPDPYPKKPRKRMTAARYLDVYKQICLPGAEFHLKTDDDSFYEFSLLSLNENGCHIQDQIEDLYEQDRVNGWAKVKTTYEKRHLAEGKTIKYIHFFLPKELDHYE